MYLSRSHFARLSTHLDKGDPVDYLNAATVSLADSLRNTKNSVDARMQHFYQLCGLCELIKYIAPSADDEKMQETANQFAWISEFLVDEVAGRAFTITRDRKLVRLKANILSASEANQIFRDALSRYVLLHLFAPETC